MWPRSASGISSQVSHHESSAPSNDGRSPASLGKTSLIRWSYSGPSTPHSASAAPPSSIRTKLGDSCSTAITSTSSRISGRTSWVEVMKVRLA